MIRVKVEAIKALQNNKSRLDVCQSYLRVGFNQAFSIKQPILIVVGGLSGSGKTTVSSMIAQMLAGKHLQSDEIRTELFTKKDMGPVGFNKGRYLPERRDLVYRHLLRRAKRLLEKGYSVVLDASFIDLDHRGLIKTLLQDNPNLISSGIWCLCSDEVAIRRLIQRRMGQSSFSEADPDIYMHQKSALQKIDKDDVFRHRIDTDLDVKSLELKVFGMLRKQLSF
jgi:predicted kinase